MADNQIDTGDLMECLVQNKHQKEMNEKCSVGVTHFQLVSVSLSALTAVFISASLILDKTNRSAKEVLSLLDIRISLEHMSRFQLRSSAQSYSKERLIILVWKHF